MVIHAFAALAHWIVVVGAAAPVPNPSADNLSKPVLDHIAGPLLTSAQFLIPAAVAISGIHKMMDHRESGGSFLVDMVTKGGHAHEDEDEFFLVLEGRLFVDVEHRETVELGPRQAVTIPRGVRHRPRAPERTVVVMMEGAGVVPTGD